MARKTFYLTLILSFATSVFSMEGIVTTVGGGGTPHIGHVDSCLGGTSSVDGTIQTSRFNYPWGITFDSKQNSLLIADCGCPELTQSNDRIRKIDLRRDIVSSLAGSKQGYKDGHALEARFFQTAGMDLDDETRELYIADSGNHAVRVLNLKTNQVTTLSGLGEKEGYVDGPVKQARFNLPQTVRLHTKYSLKRLFVADTDNHAIRVIHLREDKSTVSTITGGPNKKGLLDGPLMTAKWYHPTSLVYDGIDDVMYVSDHFNHAVRVIRFQGQTVETLAGNGRAGSIEERTVRHRSPHSASLHYPEGLGLDRDLGVLYIVEFGNNCVSMLSLRDRTLSVLAGGSSYGSRDAVGMDAQFYHPTGMDFDENTKTLYVTDQYNHRVRAVSALGSQQQANGNLMKISHLAKVDAYRDLVVHSRSTVVFFCYLVVALIIGGLAYCTRRRWIAYIKVQYAIYNKRPSNKF